MRSTSVLRSGRARRGSVLVEFAILSFVFVGLSFALLDLARAWFVAQTAAEAARVAARDAATRGGEVDAEDLFDERFGVLDLDALVDRDGNPVSTLDEVFASLPPLHAALRPLMIHEDRDGRHLLRLPGALFRDPLGEPGLDLYVRSPRVESEGPPLDLAYDPMVQVADSGVPGAGRVSLRIHHSFLALFAGGSDGRLQFGEPVLAPEGPELLDAGIGRPGGAVGFFRNPFVTIETEAAFVRDVP